MFGTSDFRVLRGVLSFSPSARSRSPQEMKKRKNIKKKKINSNGCYFVNVSSLLLFPPFFFVLPFIFRQLTASFPPSHSASFLSTPLSGNFNLYLVPQNKRAF
jgi:hypothetical protein